MVEAAILDHAQAEREAEIKPDRMGNHCGRKAVAIVQRITNELGHTPCSHNFLSRLLTLRCLRIAAETHKSVKADGGGNFGSNAAVSVLGPIFP